MTKILNFYFILFADPLFLKNNFVLIIIFLTISFILSCLMLVLPYFISGRALKINEKISEYECGFEPFDSAIRQPFTIHFYIVGILFLIFDVEIALLFPWSVAFSNVQWFGFWNILFFLLILIIGFIYEWKIDAITWKL